MATCLPIFLNNELPFCYGLGQCPSPPCGLELSKFWIEMDPGLALLSALFFCLVNRELFSQKKKKKVVESLEAFTTILEYKMLV